MTAGRLRGLQRQEQNRREPGSEAALGVVAGGWGWDAQRGGKHDRCAQKEDDDRKVYATATIDKWQKLSAKFNYSITVTTSEGKKYDIRPLLGTDAVHGNQHVSGNILFPHNVGLACSHNPDNFFSP